VEAHEQSGTRQASARPATVSDLGRRNWKLAAAKTPAVAAIITEYRSLSHADVIAGRILNGYSPDGVKVESRHPDRLDVHRSGPGE